MFKANKHNGFTLAEVLITLGIIGIISAITIPTLINKIQEKQFHVKLKKVYSTISAATAQMVMDNGGYIWDNTFDDGEELSLSMKNEYKKYFKYIKDAKDSDIRINGRYGYKSSTIVLPPVSSRAGAILKDGSDFYFYSTPSCIEPTTQSNWFLCGNIIVDVNGNAKPNMFGLDTFTFNILKNNTLGYKVVPSGKYNNHTCEVGSTTQTTSYGCTELVILGKDLP